MNDFAATSQGCYRVFNGGLVVVECVIGAGPCSELVGRTGSVGTRSTVSVGVTGRLNARQDREAGSPIMACSLALVAFQV